MKKILNKKVIAVASVLLVAILGAWFGTRALAGVERGTNITVPAGGQDVANRGTATNPFVILEVVPTVGSDDVAWVDGTNYHANFDELQAMRWGVASEVSSILANPDLLHNIAACEALRDAGVVTLGTKTVTEVPESNIYGVEDVSKRKTTPGEYVAKYLVKASASDGGDLYAFVQENVKIRNANLDIDGYGKANKNTGAWKFVNENGTNEKKKNSKGTMVYVGTGGDYYLWTKDNTINNVSQYVLMKKTDSNCLKDITNGLYKFEEKNQTDYESGTERGIIFGAVSDKISLSPSTTKMHQVAGKDKYAFEFVVKREPVVEKHFYETKYDALYSTDLFVNSVLKNVYNIPNANLASFKVQVITVSAADLNNNQALINRADLIVIEGNSSDLGGYKNNDITWNTAKALYSKATGYGLSATINRAPLVLNISALNIGSTPSSGNDYFYRKTSNSSVFLNNPTYTNNMYKLANMMAAMGVDELKSYYLNNGTNTPYLNFTTGEMHYTTRYVSDYTLSGWNSDTFAPYEQANGNNRNTVRNAMQNNTTFNWRSATNKTVIEKEYYIFTGTDSNTNAKKFFFSGATRHSADGIYTESDMYTTLHLNGAGATPLQVMEYLLKERNENATPIEGVTPSVGPTSPIDVNAVADRAPRVLEIEPYNSFDNDQTWIDRLKNLYGKTYTAAQLNIKKMTASEFIVNTDDLIAQYDLIYFGTRTDAKYYNDYIKNRINSDSSFTHKNLIYCHVGPKWDVGYNHSYGLANHAEGIKNGSNRYLTQLAGNDLTILKANIVDSFAKNGGLVAFASDFTNSSNIVDTSKIDVSSNIYSLAVKMLSASYTGNAVVLKSGMSYTAIKSKAVSLLSAKGIEISCIQRPKEYRDSGSDADRYINGSNPTDRTLRFQFAIEDNATIQNPFEYVLGLYVDLNADGRYTSSDAETLRGMSIYDSTMGMNVNPETDTLKSWHTYVVTRDVSELVGVIPWKLEVKRKSGATVTELSAALEGFSAIKAMNSEKETIRVLQIYIGIGDDAKSFDWDNGWGKTVSYLLPTTDDLINAAKAKKGNAFDPNSFATIEDMYDWFRANLNANDIAAKHVVLYDSNHNPHYINDRNYGKETTWGRNAAGQLVNNLQVQAIDNINGNNGITVTRKFYELFMSLNEFTVVCDRMSCKSYEKWVAENNSILAKYDMVILGFGDGYGDLNVAACQDLNKFISAGKTALFTHDTTSFFNDPSPEWNDYYGGQNSGDRSGNTSLYRGGWCWGYEINQYFRSKLALDRFNVTGKISNYDTEMKVDGNSITSYNQGYVDNFIDGNQETTKAIRVNRGTLTEYPYTIGEKITVGRTHNQYYQLNMEDPNIVVWYSLYSDDGNSIYNENVKDARNYYYIYNVGNVTYSGAGHNLANANDIIDELKLFVNTVVAAYRASGSPFRTYVTNEDKSSSEKTDYIYVDFDTFDTTNALGDLISSDATGTQYKRVTYLVEDNSIMQNTGITINYYMQREDANGQLMFEDDGEPVWDAVNLVTYKMAADNRTFGEVVSYSGQTIHNYNVVKETNYGFDLDLTQLSKRSSMTIKIVTTINFGSEANGDHVQFETNKYVQLIRRGFFELD